MKRVKTIDITIELPLSSWEGVMKEEVEEPQVVEEAAEDNSSLLQQ